MDFINKLFGGESYKKLFSGDGKAMAEQLTRPGGLVSLIAGGVIGYLTGDWLGVAIGLGAGFLASGAINELFGTMSESAQTKPETKPQVTLVKPDRPRTSRPLKQYRLAANPSMFPSLIPRKSRN
jgi:hypothetical protein